MAWTCALAADAVEDFNGVIELARLAVEKSGETHQNRNTLGAILYRAGKFDEAVQVLGDLATQWEQAGQSTLTSPAYTWFFLAMVHHQQGHTEEAQQCLEKARTQAEEEMMAGNVQWNRQLTLQLLQSEATQLLGIPQ